MIDSLKIALSNFRAFSHTGFIAIKPLTILVGENSTGKTSFLAALRQCFTIGEWDKTGYFNSPPFDLGAYEDIVHQSGNQSTTLRFSIEIEKNVDIGRGGSFSFSRDAKSDIVNASIKIFFFSKFGDVSLSSFVFKFEDYELEYRSESQKGFSLKVGGHSVDIGDNQRTLGFEDNSDFRARDLRYISYSLMRLFFDRPGRNIEEDSEQMYKRIAKALDAFVTSDYTLYCSPPVRSIPKRVYTSSDEGRSIEQTHAPHDLNRIKRANRRRWANLNKGLTAFGRLSGLFTRFDIAKLTKQDAGPFQLKVTVRGRSSNIADVGYGVSQALPIMTELVESNSNKSVFLFQQPEVHLHPKAQAALGTIFSQFISHNSRSFIITETHSDYLIDRVRIEARNGLIHPDLVNILYFEPDGNDVNIHEISIDKQGNVKNAPPSYREFFISEQEKVLGI